MSKKDEMLAAWNDPGVNACVKDILKREGVHGKERAKLRRFMKLAIIEWQEFQEWLYPEESSLNEGEEQ